VRENSGWDRKDVPVRQAPTASRGRQGRLSGAKGPREALEQKTPATCYQSSPRIYPDRIPQPEYDSNIKPKRVYPDGTFFWKGTQIFISKCLGGESIGIEPVDDRYWDVHFATFPLARFDSHKLVLQPISAIKE